MEDKEVQYDFTSGRIFSCKNIAGFRIIEEFLGVKFPWEPSKIREIHSEEDFGIDYAEPLFYTGTNKEIIRKMEYSRLVVGGFCDRCGKELRLDYFPWNLNRKYSGLCEECSIDMEKDYGSDMFGMPNKEQRVEYPWWLV